MRYIIRAVKYFFYYVFLLVLILGILIVLGMVKADIGTIFKNGYDSLWQIALMFAVVSAIYPKFGFTTRNISLPERDKATPEQIREEMLKMGYTPEKEEANILTFRRSGFINRLFRMCEDRVTVTIAEDGCSLDVEGLRRDIVLVAMRLQHALRSDIEE